MGTGGGKSARARTSRRRTRGVRAKGEGTMAASKELLKGLEQSLEKEGEKLVKMFKGVALFKIDGQQFLLDLKSGKGKLYMDGRADDPKPDVTLTMSDDVFVKLASGKLALSMKLTPVLKAAQPKANL